VTDPGSDRTDDCCARCFGPLEIIAMKFSWLKSPSALWACPGCGLVMPDKSPGRPKALLFQAEGVRSMKGLIVNLRRSKRPGTERQIPPKSLSAE